MAAYKPGSRILNRSPPTDPITAAQKEQFAPLNYQWRQFYLEIQEQLARELWDNDESDEACRLREELTEEPFGCEERYQHNKQDISTIITTVSANEKLSINSVILDDYANAIADYANRLRWEKKLAERAKIRAQKAIKERWGQSKGSKTASSKSRGRSRSPRQVRRPYRDRDDPSTSLSLSPEREQESIAVITNDTFAKWISNEDTGSRDSEIRKYLKEQNLQGKNFMELDYLLIPYHYEKAHYIIMGIAPKQKFIFVIDSAGWKINYSINTNPLQTVFAIACMLIDPKEEYWPIFAQWATRGQKKVDESPNCAVQTDSYNCGIFAATNAMCLAFGYDLLCYREEDLSEGKRPRMFAELWACGTFDAPFNYDLFDIPDTLATTKVEDEDEEDTVIVIQHGFAEMGESVGAYPRQFSRQYFKRAGFLYVLGKGEKAYWDAIETKEGLIAACVAKRIEAYEEWSNWSTEVFRKWIINECAASRKIEGRDPLQPMEGIGKQSFGLKEDVRNGNVARSMIWYRSSVE